ncbi:MAG: uroporphyrinogen decarboxylase [Firmicutes bacterium]|nr:uroporphyrinogen decarboxylase [Bacillota bacterium]
MPDAKTMKQERISNYHDVADNKIPKRVPVGITIGFEATVQYFGYQLQNLYWNPGVTEEEKADQLCQSVYSDVLPFSTTSMRFPTLYQYLESQSFVMSSRGFMQHPEVVGMLPEDYDYLIEKPLDCLLERVIPRHYKSFNVNDPISMTLNFTKGILGFLNDPKEGAAVSATMRERYGYYPGPPAGSGGFTAMPFDFLADQLRSFSGISKDIRRMPEILIDACEALYPIVFKRGLPKVVSNYGTVNIPLHMPTFMREKDFEKLWWPTAKRLVEEYASMGIHCNLFCEDNWMRYLDHLSELPTDTTLRFEYGDPKLVKQKLGDKFILGGLYPMQLLKNGTKQQCIDKAKEVIDALAPGGKYAFSMDKGIQVLSDLNIENLNAVGEFIRDYAVYDNAGEAAGKQFNKADYKAPTDASFKIDSKYYSTWEEYKAKYPNISDFAANKIQSYEDQLLFLITYLLV